MISRARRDRWRIALFVISICVSVTAGCNSRSTPQSGETAEGFAQLTRSLATQHDPLKTQLIAIQEEENFPLDLTSRDRTIAGKNGRKRAAQSWLPDDQNFAIGLASIVRREPEKIDGMLASESLPWTREAMERVESLVVLRRVELTRIRDALDLPQCDFGIRIDDGLLADVIAVQRALYAGRLLAVATLLEVRQGKLDEAEIDIRRLLHLANGLSREPHLVPRVAAARVREDAFVALQAFCLAPNVSFESLQRIYRDLSATISQWPHDAHVWRGERAQGLHAYEMIRGGELLSLLKKEEMQLARNRGIQGFTAGISAQIDEDEHFYLTVMEKLIEACDKPYYARQKTVDKLRVEFESIGEGTRSAWVAKHILLAHVFDGHYWQGHDRALAEAWLLALGAATFEELPIETTNPLTGKPFRLESETSVVRVGGISDPNGGWTVPEPLTVPRLADVTQRGRYLR